MIRLGIYIVQARRRNRIISLILETHGVRPHLSRRYIFLVLHLRDHRNHVALGHRDRTRHRFLSVHRVCAGVHLRSIPRNHLAVFRARNGRSLRHGNDQLKDGVSGQREVILLIDDANKRDVNITCNDLAIRPRRTIDVCGTRTTRYRILHTRLRISLGIRIIKIFHGNGRAATVFETNRVRARLSRRNAFLILHLRHEWLHIDRRRRLLSDRV